MGNTQLTRREAIERMAGAGFGIIAGLGAGEGMTRARAQGRAAQPGQNPKFPPIPTWKTELRQLAPNVHAYIQGGGPGIGNGGISNAGIVIGPRDVLVVDALGAPLHTKAFIAAAQKVIGGKPFGRVVITHDGPDHTSGSQYFEGAEIVGSPFCREQVMKSASWLQNPDPRYEAREGYADGTEVRKLAPPTTTFTDRVTYHYGDTVVEVSHFAPAHTWTDVMVYLPQTKIFFAGDVAFHSVTPLCRRGHVSKWLELVDRILALDIDTIVPGHGHLGGKKDLADMAEYLRILKSEAKKRFDAKASAGRAAFDIEKSGALAKFQNWNDTERIAENVVRLFEEFSGSINPVQSIHPSDADVALHSRRATEANKEYNSLKEKGAA